MLPWTILKPSAILLPISSVCL